MWDELKNGTASDGGGRRTQGSDGYSCLIGKHFSEKPKRGRPGLTSEIWDELMPGIMTSTASLTGHLQMAIMPSVHFRLFMEAMPEAQDRWQFLITGRSFQNRANRR